MSVCLLWYWQRDILSGSTYNFYIYAALFRDSFIKKIKSWIRIFSSMKIWNREQNVLLTGWKISLPILIDVKVNKVY